MKNSSVKIIVITGPTATGKSNLAIKKAIELDSEIIYADSRAVYKGFDIVSAKPTKEEMQDIPHHLIDIVEPNVVYSAGDFVNDAEKKIDEIIKRNKKIIITGGTWFYIKSLLSNYEIPKIPGNKELREELDKKSNEELYEILIKIDKKRAGEININDRKKVIRSIEMSKALNMPISEYKNKKNEKYDVEYIVLSSMREELYEKINKRVDKMVEMGLFDEFQKMVKKWGKDNINIKNTIGYKEFLENEDINEAILKIKQHTRNFAKRQMTYFRNCEF